MKSQVVVFWSRVGVELVGPVAKRLSTVLFREDAGSRSHLPLHLAPNPIQMLLLPATLPSLRARESAAMVRAVVPVCLSRRLGC